VWAAALARARDDRFAIEDMPVYDYVHARGLSESWDWSAFGVLSQGMSLHPAASRWPERGYRMICPLYDVHGEVINVQARTIQPIKPKTLFPADSTANGTVFATEAGLEILRRTWRGVRRVLLGEGLTDHLAFTITAPLPTLCAPGTGLSVAAIGDWITGFELILAADVDLPGDRVVHPTAARAYANGATDVQRLDWPAGAKDACEVIEQIGVDGLHQFLKDVCLR
jgi:DNA primase